jgi:hypothetical protein
MGESDTLKMCYLPHIPQLNATQNMTQAQALPNAHGGPTWPILSSHTLCVSVPASPYSISHVGISPTLFHILSIDNATREKAI